MVMPSVSLREQIANRLLKILGTYVLGFGALIFLLTLSSVVFFHHSQLRQYKALIETKLSAELSAIVRESDSVGNSSVVWTGLTDSIGREAYLEPLLAKMNRSARHQIDLLDYRGRDFILSPTSGQRPRLPAALIERTIEESLPQLQLHPSEQGQLLLFSLPVIAPFSDSPLGILLSSINLSNELSELGLPPTLGLKYSLTVPPPDTNEMRSALKTFSTVPIRFDRREVALYIEITLPIWQQILVALMAVVLTLAGGAWLYRRLGRWAGTFAEDLTARLDALVQVTSKLATEGHAPVFHDDAGDEITAVFDAVQAIVLRQRATGQKLQVSSRVFETAAEAILITDGQGRIADVNAALLRMTGYPREELIGQPAGLLYRLQETTLEGVNIGKAVSTHGEWRGETFFLTREQRQIPVILAVSALFDEQQNSLGHVAIFSDISDIKQAEDRLRELSYQDPLTGLPNYRAFSELMTRQLRPDGTPAQRFALLFIDLDHLKLINDSYGHEQGDQVILQIAQNLSRFLPKPHFLCRRSGDEFIAILYMDDSVDGMQQRLRDSMQSVTHRIELPGGVMAQASFSVGAVVYPDHAHSLNELLVLADSALQFSKDAGRARVTWLNSDIIQRLTRRHRIEARLDQALREGLIHPHYQPEVQLRDGRVCGFEALARWHDPELGQISPAEFMPIAEHMGLIDLLTEVMLHQIVDNLTPLRARFPEARVAFNVSAKQLSDRRIFRLLTDCFDNKSSRFEGLVMEVTETELIREMEDANLQLEMLIGLGIEIAIDDFGKGYSSLARLGQLPIRKLKIDSSFVWSLQDPNTVKIIQAVLALARALRMEVTVEGVETPFQRDVLLGLGCNKAQGFLFARPMALQDILALPPALPPHHITA
jgi:diguanylate cyclase (GGDEF)-like protein/PAS domain S-box-containing protein